MAKAAQPTPTTWSHIARHWAACFIAAGLIIGIGGPALLLISDAAARSAAATADMQEYGSMAPRGMPGRASLQTAEAR